MNFPGEKLVLEALGQAVRLLANGNREELESMKKDSSVPAEIDLPGRRRPVAGYHKGPRVVEFVVNRVFCCLPRYHLVAVDRGSFVSDELSYTGNFFNGQFHDHTGNAEYYVAGKWRYAGHFKAGRRDGPGRTQVYDSVTQLWRLEFDGEWKDDRKWIGKCYLQDGSYIQYSDGKKLGCTKPSVSSAKVVPTQLDAAEPEPPPNTLSASHTVKPAQPARHDVIHSTQSNVIVPTLTSSNHASSSTSTHNASLRSSTVTASASAAPDSHSVLSLTRPSSLPSVPPIDANPLLLAKLANPKLALSPTDSITLLTQCIHYGHMQAHKAHGKHMVLLLGNTGAGKSTVCNWLAGCRLVKKSPEELPEELGSKLLEPVLVVCGPSEGGPLAEVMPIGHSKQSKTFMPQIESPASLASVLPDSCALTLCDCPGFLDNRGVEINIANAVNIRAAINCAASVRAIILVNYASLKIDRGRGLTELLKMTCDLFGTTDQLKQHKSSLLIGVSNTPSDMALSRLHRWMTSDDPPPLMHDLAERLFLFDATHFEPTRSVELSSHSHDQPNTFQSPLTRSQLLSLLRNLVPITSTRHIFSTVLTDEDETALLRLSEGLADSIQSALNHNKLSTAAASLRHLHSLSIIDHVVIERLLQAQVRRLNRQFVDRAAEVRSMAFLEKFDQAVKSLDQLEKLARVFEAEGGDAGVRVMDGVDCASLRSFVSAAQEKVRKSAAAQRALETQLAAAISRTDELLTLLEQQRQQTQQQMDEQKRQYDDRLRQLESSMAATTRAFEDERKALALELEARLKQKTDELAQTHGNANKQQLAEQLAATRAALEAEYQDKLRKAEQDKNRELARQQQAEAAAKQEREQQLAAMQRKLEEQQNKLRQAESERKNEIEKQKEIERRREMEEQAAQQQKSAVLNAEIHNNPKLVEQIKQLKQNKLLTEVSLRNNSIGDSGAIALAAAFKECKSLTEVWLDNNSIGHDGAIALAAAFKECKSLTEVWLYNNSIGDSGAIALAAAFKECKSLTKVWLDNNSIGEAGAIALAAAFKECKSLTEVGLHYNSIGDSGAIALAAAFKECKSLTQVWLSNNSLGEAGAIALAAAFKECKSLTLVWLNNNSIGDSGASALAAAFKQCKSLTNVRLENNSIGEAGKAALLSLQRAFNSSLSLTV